MKLTLTIQPKGKIDLLWEDDLIGEPDRLEFRNRQRALALLAAIAVFSCDELMDQLNFSSAPAGVKPTTPDAGASESNNQGSQP